MQQANLLMAVLMVLAACGGGADPRAVDGGTDADNSRTDADARETDPGSPICPSIPVVSIDLEPWRAATVQWLREQSHVGTTSEPQAGDTIHLRGFRAAVGVTDPGPGAIDWLLSLPDFPVPPEEVEVGELKLSPDSATVIVTRPLIGSTPGRLFRPLASVQLTKRLDGTWEARSFTVWASTALISEDEAIALTSCSPEEPPPSGPIRETTFEGLAMQWCEIVDSYAYRPNRADHVEYAAAVDWVVVGEFWRARRGATLVIAENNYWVGIQDADCYCDYIAGFELHVDATSGEVLDYRPGVNCVVC